MFKHRPWVLLIAITLLTLALAGCDDDTDPAPQNQPPTAAFTISSGRHIGTTITFTSTAFDPDGSITDYHWHFGTDPETATTATAMHTYYTTGNVTVTLTVTDDAGATATAHQQLEITNAAPTTHITGPTIVHKSDEALFSCSATDTDGDTVTEYAWDLGNGATSTAMVTDTTYANSGTFVVTCTTRDEWGAWSPLATHTVTVMNRVPVAVAGADRTITLGDDIAFDASGAYDDDGDALSFAWDFGDGNTSTTPAPTHTYASGGTYTVTLTVDDGDGGTDTDTLTVTVEIPPQPPVADAGPDQSFVFYLESATFNGSGSYDPDGTIVNYHWNFGDGSTAEGIEVTHQFTHDGDFTVTLTVTDDEGLTDTDTCIATALNS